MSFTANSTGGEYTHKLTVDEMPSHRHKLTMRNNSSAGAYYARPPLSANSGSNYDADREDTIASKGGDVSHNNIQPYITVYFWRRTA